MYCGICPERERLLREVLNHLTDHYIAATTAGAIEAAANDEILAAWRQEVHESLEKAEAAWNGYRKHIEEHGC